MAFEPETNSTTTCDLDKLAKTALSKRELAWALLKDTRNPLYVSMRYDYPLDAMEKALETIPVEKSFQQKLDDRHNSNSRDNADSSVKSAGELVSEMARPREPGEDDDLE